MSESGMSRSFWGRIKGAKYRFALQDGPWLPLETRPDSPGEPGMQPRDPCLPWRGKLRDCSPGHAGKEGPQLARTGASQGFPRAAVSWSSRAQPWRQRPLGPSPGDRAVTVPALPQAAPCRGPSSPCPLTGRVHLLQGHLPVRAASERGLRQEALGWEARGACLQAGSPQEVGGLSHPRKLGSLSPRRLTLGSWGACLHASSPGLASSPSALRGGGWSVPAARTRTCCHRGT